MILVRKQGFSLFERRTLDVTGGKGVVRNHRGSLGVALLRATAKKLRRRWTIGSGAMRSGSGPRASPSAGDATISPRSSTPYLRALAGCTCNKSNPAEAAVVKAFAPTYFQRKRAVAAGYQNAE